MSAERLHQASMCRIDTWHRLSPVLSALHVPRDQGPEALVNELHEAPLGCRAEALRMLRAFGQYRWSVQRLPAPLAGAALGRLLHARDPRLGFRVVAGPLSWWLRFEPSPRLLIRHIERLGPHHA